MTSDTRLALAAGVSYDTLMNWFSGRTVPRPAELKRVGDAIDLRLVDLMDAYDGRDPSPPSLEASIAELVAELRVFVHEARLSRALQEESTAAILRALGAAGRPGPGARPDRTDAAAPSGSRRAS